MKSLPTSPAEISAQMHTALGLFQQGRLEEAEAVYANLLLHGFVHPDLFVNLAAMSIQQKRYRDAITFLRRALELDPIHPQALANSGLAYRLLGDLQASHDFFQRAITVDPSNPLFLLHLGISLHQLFRHEEALQVFREALSIPSIEPSVLRQMRGILIQNHAYGVAEECARRLISLGCATPKDFSSLGVILAKSHNLPEAVTAFQASIRASPQEPSFYENLALAYRDLGDIDSAISAFDVAISLQPGEPRPAFSKACCQLQKGDYAAGLFGYELRRQLPMYNLLATPSIPEWGGDGDGLKHLLLVAEQGLGDTLQFMRYAPVIAERYGCQVTLCVPEKLVGLVRCSEVADVVCTPESVASEPADRWMPLLSTPRLLNVSPSNPIRSSPYIRIPSGKVDDWSRKIRDSAKHNLIVGLNWQASPIPESFGAEGRSFPLRCLEPLASVEHIRFLSLQKGYGSQQLQECDFGSRFVECQSEINTTWDFIDTAAIIYACDIVITCDTVVAHLAGGMGCVVWLMAKRVPEWRWGLDGEQSFWYPTMTIYRQSVDGAWEDVVDRVKEKIAPIAAS